MASLLLGTKTYLPQPKSNWVHRPRLLESLDRSLQDGRRVILLSSTAGSGKSTLVSDWAGQAKAAVCWLALDAQDNDPALFWGYAIAALQRRFPGFGQSIQAGLLSPQPPPVDLFLPDLLNQITELPGRVVLALDDYHLIEGPAIHDNLIFLVDHAPDNFTLVLSTRVDPPMPLSRWRARGYLAEIRAGELRFQDLEAAEFLNSFMGLCLDQADVALLEARTEGWAAGLQLAALSMQGKPDPKAFLSRFSASHQYILDYLTSEVLSQQPAEVQNFLVQTSILDRLCAPLCDALLKDEGGRLKDEITPASPSFILQPSAFILDLLDRSNLFLLPLDDTRTWYRYHHLFAELLQIRFSRQPKDVAAEYHLRAARWHDAQGNVDAAIHHALAGGNASYAAGIAGRNWQPAVQEGRLLKAQKWLESLPKDVVNSDPIVCIASGWVAGLTGKTDLAASFAGQVDRALDEMQVQGTAPVGDPGYAALPGQAASLHALLAIRSGSTRQVIEYAQKAIEHAAPGDLLTAGTAYMALSAAYRQQGRIEEGIEALENSLSRMKAVRNTMVANLSAYHLGRMFVAQGRLRQAEALFETALAESKEISSTPAIGALLIGLSGVRYEQNRLAQADELLLLNQDLNRRGGSHDLMKNSLILRAQICQARGDGPGALAVAEELVAISREDPIFLAPALAYKAWIQARNGQFEEAQRWTETVDAQWHDHPGFAGMATLFYLARVYLALQRSREALALLERLSEAAEASRGRGWQIEARMLQALGYAQLAEPDQALRALTESLALAEPEGFMRLFLDEGQAMRELLKQVLAQPGLGPLRGTIERLLAAFPGQKSEETARRKGRPETPYEPLSQRELEVLQLLAQGLPNNEIARRLYISLATVKTHIIHIFGKLIVQNRVEAINRAKALGLI